MKKENEQEVPITGRLEEVGVVVVTALLGIVIAELTKPDLSYTPVFMAGIMLFYTDLKLLGDNAKRREAKAREVKQEA